MLAMACLHGGLSLTSLTGSCVSASRGWLGDLVARRCFHFRYEGHAHESRSITHCDGHALQFWHCDISCGEYLPVTFCSSLAQSSRESLHHG